MRLFFIFFFSTYASIGLFAGILNITSVSYSGFEAGEETIIMVNILITEFMEETECRLWIHSDSPSSWQTGYYNNGSDNYLDFNVDPSYNGEIISVNLYITPANSVSQSLQELSIKTWDGNILHTTDTYHIKVVIDKDFDIISLLDQKYIAEKFLPILRLDDGSQIEQDYPITDVGPEVFIPQEIDVLIDGSEIWDRSTDNFISNSNKDLLCHYKESTNYIKFHGGEEPIDIINWYIQNKENYNNQLYVSFLEEEDKIILTYWFFYLFNNNSGWTGLGFDTNFHVGDWEGMNVVFDKYDIINSINDAIPIGVATSSHTAGHMGKRRNNWNNIEKINNHPIVYVCNGSHATYFHRGKSDNQAPFPGPYECDYHYGDGSWVIPYNLALNDIYQFCNTYDYTCPDPDNNIIKYGYEGNSLTGIQYVILPRLTSIINNENFWHSFGGVWGQSTLFGVNTRAESTSPSSPPFIESVWNGSWWPYTPGDKNYGFKWFHPYQWYLDQQLDPNISLIVDFSTDQTSGNTPLNVNFTDQSSDLASNWFWDFGDGWYSQQQNVSHLYTISGTYNVSLTVSDGLNSVTKILENYIIANIPSYPILSNGTVNPQTGYPSTSFNFLVAYSDPGNQEPDYVDLIVNDVSYSMTGSGDWETGVDFTRTLQFEIGEYEFHFDALSNGQPLRYPTTGELTFIVVPQTGEGITLDFEYLPFTVGEEVEISATLNPPLSDYPIDFYSIPQDMGAFLSTNPILTDNYGIARVDFFPLNPGVVRITAQDENNASNYIQEYVSIEPEEPASYEITASTSYYSGGENECQYMIYLRIWNNIENDWAYYEQGNITTNIGLFSNNNNHINFTTDDDGEADIPIYFMSNDEGQSCVLTIQIEEDIEVYNFEVQLNPPELVPFFDLSVPANNQTLALNSLNSNLIYFTDSNGANDLCKEYSLVDREISNDNYFTASDDIELLRFSENHEKVVLTTGSGIEVYDLNTGNFLASATGFDVEPDDPFGDLQWIDDSKILVGDGEGSEYESKVYRYTGSSNLQNLYTLENDSWRPSDVSVGENLMAISYMDSNGHDGIVKVWDHYGSNQFIIDPHPGMDDNSYSVDLNSFGNLIAVGEKYSNEILVYSINGNNVSLITTLSSGSATYDLAWRTDSNQFLASSDRENIYLWDVVNQTLIGSYDIPGGMEIFEMSWSSNGEYFGIANGYGSKFIKLFAPWDQTGPSISITNPVDNSSTTSQSIILAGIVNDNTGILSVEYNINGGNWLEIDLNGNQFNQSLDLDIGDNIITVKASDLYNNQSNEVTHVNRLEDLEPPIISDPMLTNNNPIIGDVIVFSALIQDGWSGVNPSSVRCFIQLPDGNNISTLSMYDDGINGDASAGDEIYTCQINTENLTEINHHIDIKAEDYNYNENYMNNFISFFPYDLPTFDNVEIFPLQPTIQDDVLITIEINDQSCISNAILYYNTETNDRRSKSIREIGLVMDNITDSEYQTIILAENSPNVCYYVVATDGMGNISYSEEYNYQIDDNIAPVIFNLSQNPSDINEDTQGSITVNVNAIDVGYSGLNGTPQIRYQRGEDLEIFSSFTMMDEIGESCYSLSIPEPSETWDSIQSQSLTYQIIACDYSNNESDTLEVIDYIESLNDIPLADAGEDQDVYEGNTIYLDGTGSSDPDNDPLTYLWTAPDGITLSDPTSVTPSFDTPVVPTNEPVVYEFTLTVNDGISGRILSDPDVVDIT
ncbi:MAG: PKD domain-containing protein, partial [Candidatus Delongbacteria bacterium]|nr:PKD domain-containing protein [Candidatus Delongbacteria bacterium]